jgi:hypothetical protein
MTSDKITQLEGEIIAILRTLEDLKKFNTLGKTKQLNDEIDKVLNYYNYNR